MHPSQALLRMICTVRSKQAESMSDVWPVMVAELGGRFSTWVVTPPLGVMAAAHTRRIATVSLCGYHVAHGDAALC